MIGLRYHVGADWIPYEQMFSFADKIGFARAISLNDPGYFVLNWAVQQLGGELWWVNLVCGSVFSWGLIRFAEAQERPWLTVLVAVPYLIIVVGMAYSRQAVSIGIILVALTSYIKRGSLLRVVGYIFIASMFHKTAVLAFPLIAFGAGRSAFFNAILVAGATFFLYNYFLSEDVELLVTNYIVAKYSSQGAAIRVAIDVAAAAAFFLRRRELGFSPGEYLLWRNFSLVAVGLLILLFVVPSSTAVDRLALYIIPLQLAVLPRAWPRRFSDRSATVGVILYSAIIQFAWLNFAVHARFWVPYKLWPFE